MRTVTSQYSLLLGSIYGFGSHVVYLFNVILLSFQ